MQLFVVFVLLSVSYLQTISANHVIKELPIEVTSGTGYSIFRPITTVKNRHELALLTPPEQWMASLTRTLERLDSYVTPNANEKKLIEGMTVADRARKAYLQMLQRFLLGTAYGSSEKSVEADVGDKFTYNAFKPEERRVGGDWAFLGVTMAGELRLNNVEKLLDDVIKNKVPGDYIETGVWRGGCSAYARGVIRSHGEGNLRRSYVCDSFAGLPPLDKRFSEAQEDAHFKWDEMGYLRIHNDFVSFAASGPWTYFAYLCRIISFLMCSL